MRNAREGVVGRRLPGACAVVCGVFFSVAAVAQPALPEGVHGERARAMVAILTGPAGDPAAIEPIVAANWAASALAQRPAAERAQALAGVRLDLGSAELVRIDRRAENELSMIFRSAAKGLWLTVGLRLEPQPPRGILAASMQLDSNPPPEAGVAAGTKLTLEQAMAQAAARIDELAAREEFSGVVLVARRGEVLLERAAGLADRDRGIANRPATRFNIGSITKAFTQVLISQLAAEGKVALEDKLLRHLPDYPDRAVAEQVTLGQLLDHRSGLGDIFNERFTPAAAAQLRTLADHLPLFVGKPLEFTPGTAQRYSNAGYIVLGLVVERITGQSFSEAARERIFAPSGMVASGWLRRDALPGDAAVGYTREGWQGQDGLQRPPGPAVRSPEPPAPRQANTLALPAIGSSAGGSYSTARDLLAFDRTLAANRVTGSQRYAQQGGLGIAGGTVGANATLESDWESGWTFVVLENFDPPAAERLTRELRELFARVEASPGG